MNGQTTYLNKYTKLEYVPTVWADVIAPRTVNYDTFLEAYSKLYVLARMISANLCASRLDRTNVDQFIACFKN